MTRLILLIGLPGSGKSTLAHQLIAEWPSYQLVSTDAIRAQLFGSEAIQGEWLRVWRQVQRQFQTAVAQKATVIYDATNAQRCQRRWAIALARETGFTHITGIWLRAPLLACLERNRNRPRQVPEEVVFRMHRQLSGAPPAVNEGMDFPIYYGKQHGIVGELRSPASKNRTPGDGNI
ncbi:MAG: AAA family ATPase [Hormoscilla sp. GUM202]|nr:AAA family ATPase [Hormoscilla sp. GUM202]